MVEAVPAEAGSGAATAATNPNYGNKGSEGIFYTVSDKEVTFGQVVFLVRIS